MASLESLEDRVARLEAQLPGSSNSSTLNPPPWAVALLGAGSVYLGVRGFGLPNHPYQVALGALTVALAYHRGWLKLPDRLWIPLLGLANIAMVSLLFKLFIGSGRRLPFYWLRYPEFQKMEGATKSWLELLPQWSLSWTPSPLALWELDLTLLQTFLLIVTLVGALFRFQPFVSLTALALIGVSLPALAEFHWDWVFPAMVGAGITLYLQSAQFRSKPRTNPTQ